MYKIIRTASYIIRFWFAYLTIEKVSIFESEIASYFWGEIFSIYTLLLVVSYGIVGLFYSKGEDHAFGSLAYFVVYCVLLFLYWISLLLLTWLGILPINI